MAKPIVSMKWDARAFEKALREYALLSKRALPDITNKKGLFIARGAIRETPAVSAEEIRAFVNQNGGENIGKIINARRASKGEKGLFGKDMQAAIKIEQGRRLRSRAFLKSGWIWVIRELSKVVGGSANVRGARAFGQAKGKAIPARPGWRVVTTIINMASAAWDKREGADKVATPALQRSFDNETGSMEKEIEHRMKDGAHKAGIKTR